MPETSVISLPDRRRLAYSEYGARDGRPVVYFHGTPSAHNEWDMFGNDALLVRLGLRLIAPDRPGMGRSTFQSDRRIVDWPADLQAILAELSVDRFAVLGYSGGVPYAVATILAMPERVTTAGLVATVCHDRPELAEGLDPNGMRQKELARRRPFISRQILRAVMELPARIAPNMLIRSMKSVVPDPDRRVLEDSAKAASFAAAIREAFRQGPRGPQYEFGMMAAPWRLDLHPTSAPIHIWQGELDNFGARPAMAQYVHDQLGAKDLHLLPEGHLSIFANHVEEVLGEMAADSSAAGQ